MKTEGQNEMICLQAKEYSGIASNHQKLGENCGTDPAFGGSTALQASSFWTSDLQEYEIIPF